MQSKAILSTAALALAAGICGFTALPAAETPPASGKPPTPLISMKVTKQNLTNDNAGTRRVDSITTVRNFGNDYVYVIDIRNTGKAPAKDLQIEYFVMYRVTSGTAGSRESRIDCSTGGETLEIPAGGMASVRTFPISGTGSSTVEQRGMLGSGVTVASTTRQMIGIYIEAKLDGKVIGRHENPTGVKTKMDAMK